MRRPVASRNLRRVLESALGLVTLRSDVPFLGARLPATRRVTSETARTPARIVVVDAADGAAFAAALGAASRRTVEGAPPFETVLVSARNIPPTADGDIFFVAETHAGVTVAERSFVVTSASYGLRPLTGVDVLAYLRNGAAGVVDAAVLVAPETVEACLISLARDGGRFVVGEPAHLLAELYGTVREDWPSDGYGELDPLCFRAALALAQITRLRPLDSGRRNYGYTAFAAGLNARSSETGFSYTPGHLRRALARLARLWSPDEDLDPTDLSREPGGLDAEQRTMLPELARQNGFPSQLPALRDVPRERVPAELWNALESITEYEEERRLGTLVLRFRIAVRATTHPRRGGQ